MSYTKKQKKRLRMKRRIRHPWRAHNGTTMFNGYMEARFIENPFANYSMRLEPFIRHSDADYYQLDLSVEK